tara:strand:- start:497 stop:742 length:246 start_codon:yes stop_codon:yes gene_type:complete
MASYILYVLVFLILIFVIFISSKAVKEGIKAKKKITFNKNDNLKNSDINILDKINEAEEMKKKKIISKEEFEQIKKKLLNK